MFDIECEIGHVNIIPSPKKAIEEATKLRKGVEVTRKCRSLPTWQLKGSKWRTFIIYKDEINYDQTEKKNLSWRLDRPDKIITIGSIRIRRKEEILSGNGRFIYHQEFHER